MYYYKTMYRKVANVVKAIQTVCRAPTQVEADALARGAVDVMTTCLSLKEVRYLFKFVEEWKAETPRHRIPKQDQYLIAMTAALYW